MANLYVRVLLRPQTRYVDRRCHGFKARHLSTKGPNEEPNSKEDPAKDKHEVHDPWKNSKSRVQHQIVQTRNWLQTVYLNWKNKDGEKRSTGADVTASDGTEWYSKRVNFWMRQYEDFVGLTEVKQAQGKVVELERRFIEQQDSRREAQSDITSIQSKIKEIHGELEKTYRGEDKYLTLVTQEHQVLKEEKALLEDFTQLEKRERECFALLSNAVRDSHEKERAQAEKTKYWSVLGSILGTCLGIIGTTINNRLRMRELRELVAKSSSGEGIREVNDLIGQSLRTHEARLKDLVTQIQHVITDSKLNVDKIGEMRLVFNRLEGTVQALANFDLESQMRQVNKKNEKLFQHIVQQHRQLQNKFQDLRANFDSQGAIFENAFLSREKRLNVFLQNEAERDKKLDLSFESLYKNQSLILSTFQDRLKGTEDGVREIKTVINSVQNAATARREKEKNLLQDLDATLLDKVEEIMDDHEAKTIKNVLGIVLVVTPLVVYTMNKLF